MASTRLGRLTSTERAAFAICVLLALSILGAAIGLTTRVIGNGALDQEAIGRVASQDRTAERCSSTVSYDVEGVGYETSFDDCPGVGDLVTVRYDAADPGGGTAAGAWRAYAAYAILVVCFLGLVALVLLVGRREWRTLRAGRAPAPSLFDPEPPTPPTPGTGESRADD